MAYSIATWSWTPDTWSGDVLLEEPKVYKYLLKSNGVIYSIDETGNLLDVTSSIADINNITQLEYETLGFDDLSKVALIENKSLISMESSVLGNGKVFSGNVNSVMWNRLISQLEVK